jgi:hypothetical protein
MAPSTRDGSAEIFCRAATTGRQPLASLPVPGIVHPTHESQRCPYDASQDHDNDQQLREMAGYGTH